MTSPKPIARLTTAANRRRVFAEQLGRWRFTGKSVLGVSILAIVAAPFLERTESGLLIEGLLMSLVLVAGVLAIGGHRRTLVTAMVLAIPAVAGRWVSFVRPELIATDLFLGFAILTFGYVVLQFVKFIMNARRVDANVMCSGIAAFLLLAILWSLLYELIDRQIPGSFSYSVGPGSAHEMRGMTALYFSLVTLCTVGFGDILPVSDVARMCAMIEGATGVFFIAVLISRLVSLFTLESRRDQLDQMTNSGSRT